jgi:hypothetical protein
MLQLPIKYLITKSFRSLGQSNYLSTGDFLYALSHIRGFISALEGALISYPQSNFKVYLPASKLLQAYQGM